MSEVTLIRFTASDLPLLLPRLPQLTSTDAERLAADEIDGHWHRFFIVRSDEGVVGTVDLYQHSGYIVSAGPEIFP
ncbi:MAG: hypothetical protein K6D94_12110, partial [Clostridiales bacterium]|nr:hypothetical protein [Clostridiales bacterium]